MRFFLPWFSRSASKGRDPNDYLIYLFSGLVPWLFTQDVLSRTANVLVENISIVKSVMFPIEVLVAKTIVSTVVVQFVLFAATVIYIVVARGTIPATFLLLPVLFGLHLLMLWGLALLLAAITPYFRDVPEILRVFLTRQYLSHADYVSAGYGARAAAFHFDYQSFQFADLVLPGRSLFRIDRSPVCLGCACGAIDGFAGRRLRTCLSACAST